MPRETHFNEDWLSELDSNKHELRLWCSKGKTNTEAYCKLCNHFFSCGNRGKDQLIKHSETKKHSSKANVVYSSSQSRFAISQDGRVGATSSKSGAGSVSINDPLKAEVIWAFKVADSNFSFSSCEGLKEIFVAMFGESARNFNMDRTKVSYLISYGLGPFITQQLTSDIRNSGSFYTLCIDETTTSQVKKQLDLYVRFWSPPNSLDPVQCRYLTSLFLGHAEAERMFNEICSSIESEGLPLRKMIMLSMDGPNVNKSLFKKMDMQVKLSGSAGLVNIGSCSLHIVHNAFGSGLKIPAFSAVEDFALDVYKFFKLSSARREDYKMSQKLLEVAENYFLQFVSCRWLTISPVLKRLIEQYEALEHYFLKFLPNNQSSTCNNNQRYIRIVSALKNKLLLPLMQFVVYISDIFTKFLTMFQSEQPLVHVLYDEISELLKQLLCKFVKPEIIQKHTDNLPDIELTTGNFLSIHKAEVGDAAKRSVVSSKVSDREKLEFYEAVRSFYIKVTKKLFDTLPIKNRILRNMQCLHPIMRTEQNSFNLCQELLTQIPHALVNDHDREGIKDEWKAYQVDSDIQEHWFVKEKIENEVKYQRVDSYWQKVFELRNLDGKSRYPLLSKYIPSLLILAHGNSDVERGFSINKNIVTAERNSLAENTIRGLRSVKDYVRVCGHVADIELTKKMLDAAREASWMCFGETKRREQNTK